MNPLFGFAMILSAITIILTLPRIKINIAIAIFAGAIFLILTLGANIENLFMDICSWHDFWRIIFIVFLSLLIVALMEKLDYLKMMVDSVKKLSRSLGLSMISISAFVGLLPMPGGAYVSARLVDPMTKEMKLTPVEATTLNYWFRHLWEYWWPLYTGVIVAPSIFNVTIQNFIIHMWFLTVLAVIGGFIFIYYPIFRKKNVRKEKGEKKGKNFVLLLYSSWPVLAVMIFTLALGIDLFFSLLSVDIFLILLLLFKKNLGSIKYSFRFATNPTFLGVTAAAVFMKFAVLETNSMTYTYQFFNSFGIPPFVVIMILPYLAGLMTGVTVAYVAATFPLLLAYPMTFPAIALAYASGYGGHLTSPVHLCLVLSAKHFGADIFAVIKRVAPPVIFVLGITLLIYFLLG